jgi:hypothetical protein
MKKKQRLLWVPVFLSLVLTGLSGVDAWAAPAAAKLSCKGCHADLTSVLPREHPPVSGANIIACLACHEPASPEKAAPNPFAARIHRPHTGAKTKVDCLVCHTWIAGKGFGLLSQKGPWGPLSRQELTMLKKIAESWSDSPYLDALHARKHVTCSGCHGKRLPAGEETVENDRCRSCHESYEKLAEKTASAEFPKRNPHRSHLVALDCTKCHRSHGESKVYCLDCHFNFGMKIPGGPVEKPRSMN